MKSTKYTLPTSCDCYSGRGLCGECTTKHTPEDQRPKCSGGHPTEMTHSHRWMCYECGTYAADRDYSGGKREL